MKASRGLPLVSFNFSPLRATCAVDQRGACPLANGDFAKGWQHSDSRPIQQPSSAHYKMDNKEHAQNLSTSLSIMTIQSSRSPWSLPWGKPLTQKELQAQKPEIWDTELRRWLWLSEGQHLYRKGSLTDPSGGREDGQVQAGQKSAGDWSGLTDPSEGQGKGRRPSLSRTFIDAVLPDGWRHNRVHSIYAASNQRR